MRAGADWRVQSPECGSGVRGGRGSSRLCAMKRLRLPLLLAFAAFAGATPALAQTMAASAQDLPNWNGIWERVGSITWEPNGRPGVPENPPFTPEFAEKYRKTTEAARQGHPVADPTSMLNLVAALAPGDSARMKLKRAGKDLDASVTVGRRPKPQPRGERGD